MAASEHIHCPFTWATFEDHLEGTASTACRTGSHLLMGQHEQVTPLLCEMH